MIPPYFRHCNNSLVNFDDLLYTMKYSQQPTNTNGLQTLKCVTDLVACCESPALGDWYYPDGRRITGVGSPVYKINRGQNEVLNPNQQFYGSVRLWRRYTPSERGLFCCKLPDASNVVQTLCVNICEFPMSSCTYCELNVFSPQYFLPASLATERVLSQCPLLPLVPLLLGRPSH